MILLTNKTSYFEFLMNNYLAIGLMIRVFANGPGDLGSIPHQVITKTQENGTWCGLS